MKKLTFCLMTALMMLTLVSTPLQATTAGNPTPTTATTTVEATEANALLLRLQEIKATDKSNMTSAEKRELRKETRSIKSQLKAISGGVYVSAGVLVLVALLLILLL